MNEKHIELEEVDGGLEPMEELSPVLPAMNVIAHASPLMEPEPNLIADEQLLGIYDEMVNQIRQDRVEASDILNHFADMVMNEGDSSSASKEAIVQLLKLKMDSSNNLGKVADLMTRVKLREKNDFPRYLNAQQTNHINIGDGGAKKELLRTLNKSKKKIDHKE